MTKTVRVAKPKTITVTHTPTPWEFDGNCGGYITESGDKIARAYAREDAEFIVKAVNNHDALCDKLRKLADWLDRLATRAETEAKSRRFETLREAYVADARNYRATIKDINTVLPTDTGSVT